MEWQQWPSAAFNDRQHLPNCSGIYVIADDSQFVWYVGQAVNLQSRWLGKGHHRYPQLIRTHRKLKHRIYWRSVPAHQLDQQERFYIDQFKPELNGGKVKTYLPKQPQVEREIKRLLKVLNRNTLLFPIIRSVIAGEYVDTDGTRCILTIINNNDCFLLARSARKRYAAEVRRAWDGFDSFCGKSEQLYNALFVNTYVVNGQRFEFVASSDLLDYLEHPSAHSQFVGKGTVQGVEVATLRNLHILDQVTLQEEYSFQRDEKRVLSDGAYLRYRSSQLTPLPNAGGVGSSKHNCENA